MDMNYRGECGRERVGRMECSEGGGKWDNCNSIINKYIKKKSKIWVLSVLTVSGCNCFYSVAISFYFRGGKKEERMNYCVIGTEFHLGYIKTFWRWMVVMVA